MSEPSLAPGPTLQKLLLVDDHTVVREGLRRLLEPLAGEWRVTEASSGYQALECLRTQPCALAIVDLSLPGMSGLDLIARIRSEFPTVAVLVLTMHAEEQYALRAFQAGARGYVTKDSAAADLVAAVRKVSSGKILEFSGRLPDLVRREKIAEVLTPEQQERFEELMKQRRPPKPQDGSTHDGRRDGPRREPPETPPSR